MMLSSVLPRLARGEGGISSNVTKRQVYGGEGDFLPRFAKTFTTPL